MKQIIFLFILALASCSKNYVPEANQSPDLISSENIIVNESINSQLIDLGIVTTKSARSKRLVFINSLSTNLEFDFTELSMVLVGTPYSILSKNCTKLEPSKSCYIDLKMNYNDTFDYSTPVSFKLFPSNPLMASNTNFGNIILSGQKQAPDLTINNSAFVVSPSVDFLVASYNFPSVTKRYFLKNVINKDIIAPSMTLSADLILLKNNCDNLVLKPNQTCFFEVAYSYSTDPLKSSFQDSITFSSNDPLIDTSSLSVSLNITNINNFQPTLLSFYQPSISVIDPSKVNRLYIKNTSQKSITGIPSIALPYQLVKSTCAYLLPDATCYVDFKVNPILNVKGISMPLSFAGVDHYITVGQSSADNSVTCNAGYEFFNNDCVILSRSQSCAISNGTGLQQSTDGGITFGQCMVSYCNTGYTSVNNSCVLLNQSRSCSFTTPYVKMFLARHKPPQYSSQISNDGGVTWGICHGVKCGTNWIDACYQY